MKKILFLTFIVCQSVIISNAQEISRIVEVPGISGVDMYKLSREWFALTFNSANDVIQLEDPTGLKLIGKAYMKIDFYIKKVYVPLDLNFTINLQFKDGRYKYEFLIGEIVTPEGTKYSYEYINGGTTIEGINKVYKDMGVNPSLISEKQKQKNIENNILMLATINKAIEGISNDLEKYLIDNKKIEEW